MKKQNNKNINKFNSNKLLSMLLLGGVVISGSPVNVFAGEYDNRLSEIIKSERDNVEVRVEIPREEEVLHSIARYHVNIEGIIYLCDNFTGEAAVVGVDTTTIGQGEISNLVIPDVLTYRRTRYEITDNADERLEESLTLENNVTSIRDHAFANYWNLKGSLTIGNDVRSIGCGAFSRCINLENVFIPDSVISMGKRAFYGCADLKSVVISDGVTNIESCTFMSCRRLIEVKLGGRVEIIGGGAFYGCTNLKSVIIPDSVKGIGHSAFFGCSSLENINIIPDGVRYIGKNAFNGCSAEIKLSEGKKAYIDKNCTIPYVGLITNGPDVDVYLG